MKLDYLDSRPWMRRPLRFAVVVLAVLAVQVCALLFAQKPAAWEVLIPATIPIWTVVFVILPTRTKSES